VRMDGGNRIVLGADITLGIALLSLIDSSSVAGTFFMTVSSGSTLQINHSTTIPGSLRIEGAFVNSSSSATIVISDTLILAAGGTLNNAGTIKVAPGKFIDEGGTIIGNPPQEGSLSGASLRFLDGESQFVVGIQKLRSANETTCLISWTSDSGGEFVIESSTDLKNWVSSPSVPIERSAGAYNATVQIPLQDHRFFRIRRGSN